MNKTILIVEDEQAIADSIAYALRTEGFTPLHVTLGEQALAAMQAQPAPLLVVLDVGLPDMSGDALARMLRDMPATRDTVLVAVTGYGQPADRDHSLAAGIDHHFVKPVDGSALIELLASVAQRKRAMD